MRPDQAGLMKSGGRCVGASFPGGADIMVSFGGGPPASRASRCAPGHPILGVDSGRMGFLTQLDRRNFGDGLARMLRNGVEVESRIALKPRSMVCRARTSR